MDTLILKLKKDISLFDYDDGIWNQIKSRKQSQTELAVIYIACREILFSRFSLSPAEVTTIKYIKFGLQNEYQKRLVVRDIVSMETMSKLCEKLEADVLTLASTSSHSIYCLQPELAFISDISSSRKNKYQETKSFYYYNYNSFSSKNYVSK